MAKLCKPDCPHLKPTEAEQKAMPSPKPPHLCMKYGGEVKHAWPHWGSVPVGGSRDMIIAKDECGDKIITLWDHLKNS